MNYSVRQSDADRIPVVELHDAAHSVSVSIAPSVGNMAYEIRVAGKNVLWFPYSGPAGLLAKPSLCGVPFLGPWANRIAGDSYWANGRRYHLNPDLPNIRRDPHQQPIHGLLNFSPLWTPTSAESTGDSASATSRIEFWRHPGLMAQFPFAHNIAITHRLSGGVLEVETTLDNLSAEPMPVAIGFHPYFCLSDAPRNQWKVSIAAREHVVLNDLLTPTGETEPTDLSQPRPLETSQFDDVFTSLIPGPDGRAHFSVEGLRQRIDVAFGPKYTVAVVYAPAARDFICFEPMAALTNAFNLAHDNLYAGLQSIPPGGQWKESFWIAPSGF